MSKMRVYNIPEFPLVFGIILAIIGFAVCIAAIIVSPLLFIFGGFLLLFGGFLTILAIKEIKFQKDKRNFTPQDEQRFMNYYLRTRPEHKKFFTEDKGIKIDLKPNPNRISDENFVNSLLAKYNIKNINCEMSLFEFISNSISKANELNNTNISVRTVAEIFFRRHADELNGISFEDFRNLTFGIHTIAYNYYMTLIDDEYVSLKDNLSQTFPFSSDKVDIKVLKQDFFDYLDDAYIEGFTESAQDFVNNNSNDDIELDKKINIDKDKMFNTALNRFIDKYVNVLNP